MKTGGYGNIWEIPVNGRQGNGKNYESKGRAFESLRVLQHPFLIVDRSLQMFDLSWSDDSAIFLVFFPVQLAVIASSSLFLEFLAKNSGNGKDILVAASAHVHHQEMVRRKGARNSCNMGQGM